jgi:hypothetical protein
MRFDGEAVETALLARARQPVDREEAAHV